MLIIDTDAGIDDAEAILLALAHGDVHAITTVTGNVHVEQVIQNVFTVLQAAGKSVPVYRGAGLPLIQPWHGEGEPYHLADGLGDWDERPPQPDLAPEPEPAAAALVRMVNEAPGAYTLVALGPLTNIALACRLDPTFPQNVAKFVFMGGAVDSRGNAPALTAEYNIYTDPEAAHIVLEAFEQATMLSWTATLAHAFRWENFDALVADPQTDVARLFEGMTRKVAAQWRGTFAGYLLPDPLAMACALDPAVVTGQDDYRVVVELEGAHARGQTVVDYEGALGRPPNVTVVNTLDLARVYRLYEVMLS